MTGVFGVLDQRGRTDDPQATRLWVADVAASLARNADAWLARAGAEGDDGMTQHEAWALLGWVESAASLVVAERRPELVEAGGFALALVGAAPLDTRDAMVVASLLRRASSLIGADWEPLVTRGARRAGDLGARALTWLRRVSDEVPSTYTEMGEGASFAFRRVPSFFDPVALEQRLLAAQRASRERGEGRA